MIHERVSIRLRRTVLNRTNKNNRVLRRNKSSPLLMLPSLFARNARKSLVLGLVKTLSISKMKFSLVVLSIFASVASGAYLRKSAVAVSNNAVGEESFGSRIQISGLPHIPTNAELAILDRVLIDAYNSAHKNLDKEMVSSNSHIAIGLNNTTVIISEFVAQSDSSYCSLCTYVCL